MTWVKFIYLHPQTCKEQACCTRMPANAWRNKSCASVTPHSTPRRDAHSRAPLVLPLAMRGPSHRAQGAPQKRLSRPNTPSRARFNAERQKRQRIRARRRAGDLQPPDGGRASSWATTSFIAYHGLRNQHSYLATRIDGAGYRRAHRKWRCRGIPPSQGVWHGMLARCPPLPT